MNLPLIKLGDLAVTRFILGGNPFAGFSHQSRERDAEMRAWYDEARIVETLFQAQAAGVNAAILRGDAHMAGCLRRYWQEGGTMRWIGQTASEAPTAADGAQFCLDHGASACFIHGGVVDHLLAQGRTAELEAAVERIRGAGLPAGIAGHALEDFHWAEQHLALDFYMVCYYHPDSRRDSPHHKGGDDERFAAEDRDARVALIQGLKRPAIHYKVLAAGRTPAPEAFRFAAQHMRPGDALCAGVFTKDKPEMIREDVDLLLAALGNASA